MTIAIRLLPLLGLLACTGTDEPAPLDDSGTPGATDPFEGCAAGTVSAHSVALSQVRLDVRCQGDVTEGAPTILLLHGFPEFWMGWAGVMAALPANRRVLVPDQRGYNTSDKPADIEDYQLDHLVQDIVDLVDAQGGQPVILVGHDWGGGVAWAVAARHPELVERLVIANGPHMNVFYEDLATNPEQEAAFSYVDFFVQEGSEDILAGNDFAILSAMFEGVLTEEELVAYKEAWGQERALEGGLNWYRANFEDSLPAMNGEELVVTVPTLVLWGMDDTALLPSHLEGLPDYVEDLEIQEVEGATHWIAHEMPEIVAAGILGD